MLHSTECYTQILEVMKFILCKCIYQPLVIYNKQQHEIPISLKSLILKTTFKSVFIKCIPLALWLINFFRNMFHKIFHLPLFLHKENLNLQFKLLYYVQSSPLLLKTVVEKNLLKWELCLCCLDTLICLLLNYMVSKLLNLSVTDKDYSKDVNIIKYIDSPLRIKLQILTTRLTAYG